MHPVDLVVENFEQAIQFFGEDGLGLEPTFRNDNVVMFKRGAEIPLAVVKKSKEVSELFRYIPDVEVDVNDLNASIERVINMGGNLLRLYTSSPRGSWASVSSPEGYVVNIFQK